MRILSALSFSLLLVLASCSKDDEIISPDPLNPNQETFTSTLFVEIVDANSTPLPLVDVQFGSHQAVTNQFGIAAFPKIAMGNSNYVTARSDGYFPASRRFISSPGKSDHVKIMMLSSATAFTFSSSSGATITHPRGARIHFPANGYVRSSGNDYSGQVHVAFQVLAADNPNLYEMMPGDLVGLNSNSKLGALSSFGMIAVELIADNGDVLQLKEGASATIEMDIPTSLQATAPSQIPLWYFDEMLGVWKEEGVALRNGNYYEGNVSHFSFWNVDYWAEMIQLDLQFLNLQDRSVSYYRVCLTIPALNATICSWTNEEGKVGGLVAANEVIDMRVYNRCGDEVYQRLIGPFASDTELPAIVLDATGSVPIHISGTAVTCNGAGVDNGFIVLELDGFSGYYSLEPDGIFDLNFDMCSEANLTIQAYDLDAYKESQRQFYNYSAEITVPSLVACSNANENIASITVANYPEITRYYFLRARITEDGYTQIRTVDSTDFPFFINVFGTTAGHYPEANGYIRAKTGIENVSYGSQFVVDIESFGSPGELITGTISGILISGQNPGGGGGTQVPFTGEFIVRLDP